MEVLKFKHALESPRGLVNCRFLGFTSRVSYSPWDGIQNFSLLRSSWVMMMLLIWTPHFQNCNSEGSDIVSDKQWLLARSRNRIKTLWWKLPKFNHTIKSRNERTIKDHHVQQTACHWEWESVGKAWLWAIEDFRYWNSMTTEHLFIKYLWKYL